MCIRDSSIVANYGEQESKYVNNFPFTTRPFTPQQVALYSGCLLYTSDAADERSSVDLGGRRIIKKKKR